ncbi:MAG: MBL fold metallo-hydrolase [Brachymonas sp.]
MSLRFRSLGSGSAGNATLVEAGDGLHRRYLLVDCGLPLRHLTARLQQAGVEPEKLAAIFITHEHADHTGCVQQLALRLRIPVWMSRGTHAGMGAPDFDGLLRQARDGDMLDIAGMQLQPFTVPHDAREPLQLRCSDGDRVLGLATDLGHASAHVVDSLRRCHALLLEANHDPDMLAASNYPVFLKRRVAGDQGHLSNAASGGLAAMLDHDRLGHVLAGHLSERNNRPELAVAALAQALKRSIDEVLLTDAGYGCDWLTV